MEGRGALPTDTQASAGRGGTGPATPGGPEPPAPAASLTDATTAGRALASTLAAALPADQMEVLLRLIIKQGEERRPDPAPGPAPPAPAGTGTNYAAS